MAQKKKKNQRKVAYAIVYVIFFSYLCRDFHARVRSARTHKRILKN